MAIFGNCYGDLAKNHLATLNTDQFLTTMAASRNFNLKFEISQQQIAPIDEIDRAMRPPPLLLPLFDTALPIDERHLNPRYKTEICRNFKERSRCIYGDKCQFAHGRKELRDVVRNSKYKTKLCQKYWMVGYCAYGPRCNFLHDEMAAEGSPMEDFQYGYHDKDDKNEDFIKSTPRPSTPTNLFEVETFHFGFAPQENGEPETKFQLKCPPIKSVTDEDVKIFKDYSH